MVSWIRKRLGRAFNRLGMACIHQPADPVPGKGPARPHPPGSWAASARGDWLTQTVTYHH
jgi:hypothetical protein